MTDQKKFTGKLSGTRILIVGGSTGLGYGVAEGVIEEGAKEVIISSSQESRIHGAIASLEKSYPSAKGKIKGYVCDLGTEDTLEQNVKDLLSKVGVVDHLVYTAGDKLKTTPLDQTDFAQLKKAGMVRFFAPWLIVRYAFSGKNIAPGPASSVILTTGSISQRPRPNWSIPAGYAGGLHAMTRNFALELAPIRVNLISPGMVETTLWDHIPPETQQKMFSETGKRVWTGKVGQTVDVTEGYLMLMKDHNITGSVVSSNGGSIYV
ncbi:NAD(P)-binding protein [Rhizodiscina lignyota]|uniref:NAD(P)-binding protein n=1 Tax=Rhizodiscina lignyota TaxID=1504668 RepID=A0A9P4IK78_9PEZI|nr:NAD(P)-binding protein [Rhizodiscina lignyota]